MPYTKSNKDTPTTPLRPTPKEPVCPGAPIKSKAVRHAVHEVAQKKLFL